MSVITRKDANSIKTYDVAFKSGQYDYMGTRRNEVAEIIDWMRGPDAKLAVALTSPAPGGVLHSTVFHVLPAAAERGHQSTIAVQPLLVATPQRQRQLARRLSSLQPPPTPVPPLSTRGYRHNHVLRLKPVPRSCSYCVSCVAEGGSPSRVQGRTLMLDGFVDSQSTIDDARSAAVGPVRPRNSFEPSSQSTIDKGPVRPRNSFEPSQGLSAA